MSIITFISDFGFKDHYVSSVKASIIKYNQNIKIVDISHNIRKYDISHAPSLKLIVLIYVDLCTLACSITDTQ